MEPGSCKPREQLTQGPTSFNANLDLDVAARGFDNLPGQRDDLPIRIGVTAPKRLRNATILATPPCGDLSRCKRSLFVDRGGAAGVLIHARHVLATHDGGPPCMRVGVLRNQVLMTLNEISRQRAHPERAMRLINLIRTCA